MKFILTLGIFAVVFLFPALTFAGPIVRSGDSVSIGADQVLEDDFYALGADITVSGEAKQDVYLAGGTVTINAPVSGDLSILGGTVQIHAPIADDVRIVGGEVVLGGSVGGDVVVLGGVLKILSTAEVAGDVLYFGGQLDVSGPVAGSVIGRGETVRIDTTIGQDVNVQAMQSISLGDRTNIGGDLTYKSPADLLRAQKAVVVGDLQKDVMTRDTKSDPLSILLPFIIMLFAALTLWMLFRARIQELTNTVRLSYGMLGLIGFGVVLGVPVVSGVLMVSVIGSVVGIMLLFLYFLLITAAWVLSGVVFGTLLLKPVTKSNEVTFLTAIVGSLVYMLLAFVPYIGPLVMIAGFIIILGGLSRELYRSFR